MADTSTPLVLLEESEAGKEVRDYRKGNWTLHETVILISAKKLDDERRLKLGDKEKGRSAEFRWKWVENYCWNNGCQRSQNQCNDKWDNLLRDYKKVRDYEVRLRASDISYWQLEKHERKERGLPSNMLVQVFDSLNGIVDKRFLPKMSQDAEGIFERPQVQQPGSCDGGVGAGEAGEGGEDDWETDDSGGGGSGVPESPSAAKRRKVSKVGIDGVVRSSTELSRILLACEEKRDKRHLELLGVEQRKLQLEETKCEMNRQGMAGIITAVNNLANAILALAAHKNTSVATAQNTGSTP